MPVANQTPIDVANEYATLSFIVQQKMSQLATLTLVRIVSCTNAGGVAIVGMVTVQPLVNLMSGDRVAFPHKPLYNLPYLRTQGGANAIIIDPKPGDIGLAGFCSRDISSVKKAKDIANPGSFRMYSMADGVYIGGCLNGVPTQYVRFNDAGIEIVSPLAITLRAPTITLDGNVEATGTIHSAVNVISDTISGKTHTHSDPQGGNTGPPNP